MLTPVSPCWPVVLRTWYLLACLQVPEFRVSMSIETDKFDALYKRLKPHGVTMTALLAKAVGAALASHPVMFACEGACACSSSAWLEFKVDQCWTVGLLAGCLQETPAHEAAGCAGAAAG